MIRTKARSQEGNRSGRSIGNLPFRLGRHPRSTQGWDLALIQDCKKPRGQLQRRRVQQILHLYRESQKCWISLNNLLKVPKQHKHQESRQLTVSQETVLWKAPKSREPHSPRWKMGPRPNYPSQKNLSFTRMLAWSSQLERSHRKWYPRNLQQ